MKMAELVELDTNINSESLAQDQQPNFEKYHDDIMSFCEEERLAMYAPDVPVLDPIDQMTEIKKDMLETVTGMIHAFYCRHRVDLT